ncbi:O-methyltransferas-like protein family 3 [Delphinella strobiligena]|nr:O-methyltransferas-like protein family 3 [Delphinella strobiligena]
MDPSTNTPWAKHEKDPRWTAVDHFAVSQLQPPSPLTTSLHAAAQSQIDNGLPDIAVSPLQGQFLQLQCQLLGAKNVLEVGTLGGYSTIWLASASPDIHVTTIEVDSHHADVARKSIEKAGLADKVEVLLGSGVDVLTRLEAQVAAGSREKFDFVFIDADKQGSPAYLDISTRMARRGARIIVDNIAERDSRVKGSREAIIAAGRDGRLDATVMQTVGEKNYDGFLMCRVR